MMRPGVQDQSVTLVDGKIAFKPQEPWWDGRVVVSLEVGTRAPDERHANASLRVVAEWLGQRLNGLTVHGCTMRLDDVEQWPAEMDASFSPGRASGGQGSEEGT